MIVTPKPQITSFHCVTFAMTKHTVIAKEVRLKQSHNWNSKATDYFISLRYIRNDDTQRHCEESGTNVEAIS